MADSTRVLELVRTIAGDPGLRDRLTSANDQDRAAVLSELGYSDVTRTDIARHTQQLVPQAVEEVDDDELASVAGGQCGQSPDSVMASLAAASAATAAA